MIGRVAFWALLPSLILTSVAIGVVIDGAGDAPGDGMFDGILVFMAAVVLFVLLASMTFQALLLVRRPQSLTERALPTPIAVLQFVLYGLIALWTVLLVTVDALLFSWLLLAAIITVSTLLLTRTQKWAPQPSTALAEARLGAPVRVALWAFSVLALAAIGYVVAAFVNPTLDADGLRPLILLLSFGLPLSVVALPVALLGAFALPGNAAVLFALPVLAIVANIVVAQLLLWSPRRRVRLVNWFFRLGRYEEPATTVTGSSI